MSFFVEANVTNLENGEELQEDLTVEIAELKAMLEEIGRIRKIIGDDEETEDGASGTTPADNITTMNANFEKIKKRLKTVPLQPDDVKQIRRMEKEVIKTMNEHIKMYSDLLLRCIDQGFVSADSEEDEERKEELEA